MRYDAAQISVLDLLADPRADIVDAIDHIRSVRDYRFARSALDAALAGAEPQL